MENTFWFVAALKEVTLIYNHKRSVGTSLFRSFCLDGAWVKRSADSPQLQFQSEKPNRPHGLCWKFEDQTIVVLVRGAGV